MRLLLLRLRTSLGWGKHPDQLRVNHASAMKAVPALAVAWLVASAFSPLVIFFEESNVHRVPSLPLLLRGSAVPAIGFGIAVLILPALAISWGRFARRGAASSLVSVSGRCFEVLSRPPGYLFARIGLTSETAHWYALPLDWDEVVEPGDAEYELTVNPGSSWVERMRRLGTSPRELVQEMPAILSDEQARAAREEELRAAHELRRSGASEGATREQQQAFKRFARAQGLGWRAEGWTFAAVGWTCILGGAYLGPGLVAFFVIFALYQPLTFRDPGGRIAGITFLTAFFIIGLTLIIWGVRCVRAWWRIRPFRDEEPVSTVGEVIAWMPYRDFWGPSTGREIKETLIDLRHADGTSHIFRIPVKFAHRVRERGQMVRVEYRPTTERVVTVHRLGRASPSVLARE